MTFEEFIDYIARAAVLAVFIAGALLLVGVWTTACWLLFVIASAGSVFYISYQFRQRALGLRYRHGRWDLALACAIPLAVMAAVPILIFSFFQVIVRTH